MKAVRMFWQFTRWARAARFWWFALAALRGAIGAVGSARAHTIPAGFCQSHVEECSMQEAYTAARTRSLAVEHCVAAWGPGYPPSPGTPSLTRTGNSQSGVVYASYYCNLSSSSPNYFSGQHAFHYTSGCPAGSEWSESAGRCLSREECEGRNGAANGFPLDPSVKPFREECFAGCELKMQAGTGGCTVLGGVGGGAMHCNGVFQWTGEMCETPPGRDPAEMPEPQAKEEACSTRDGGQIKFCKKADGRECYEATGGAMMCWGVGETGQRSQGDTAQTRGPGTEAPTPTPPTPPETFDPTKTKGPETTTTTTTNPDGSERTITTTIINNTTTNGTNAPGTPGSTPPQSGGDNDGDEDEGTASGGGDCDTPPIVTGDAILGMVATQAWATRCAVDAGNAAAVTGDVGDCKTPFSVEGDHANAEQLRALRAKICNDEARIEGDEAGMRSYAATLEADIDAMESEFGETAFGEGTGLGSIVSSRFGGGGGCPIISIQTPWGATWTPPPRFCDVIAALRLLFLAVATIWALRIVGSE